jgi:predicted SAM-dependent methyltransferase
MHGDPVTFDPSTPARKVFMPEIIDKSNVMARIDGRVVDLGCGSRKRNPDHVGVDVLDYAGVDIVGDAFDVLSAIPDSALAGVFSFHFFEHVEDVPRLMGELARVIRSGGSLDVTVPHFSNPYYYSDLTHRGFYGLYTFSYWAIDRIYRRRVPTYQRELAFELEWVKLHFKSSPPFVIRHAIRRAFEQIVNLSTWTQEFYEENLSQIIGCYELRYRLVRVDT